jgi:hypothetical protein
MTNDSSKDKYEVKIKVKKGGDSFDVYLTIGKNGICNASLSSIKIDYVRYTGHIVPIKDRIDSTSQKNKMI